MAIGIALSIIAVYMFIGMTIFMGVILICDHNRDKASESDIWLLDKIKMTTQNKPLMMLLTIVVFGIVWLPLLLTPIDED